MTKTALPIRFKPAWAGYYNFPNDQNKKSIFLMSDILKSPNLLSNFEIVEEISNKFIYFVLLSIFIWKKNTMQIFNKIADSNNLEFFSASTNTRLTLPFFDGGIAAGFPSPAQDYIDLKIDLNTELISNPSSTFYARVKGTSMQDAGIMDGDILVIDKSLEPHDGAAAVCFIDGEFTLKYIKIESDAIYLVPANPKFQPIKVTEENDFCIWGIVTYSIKSHIR